jgi:protein-S-isoprenylcysteine O-methyltransferase Ste14
MKNSNNSPGIKVPPPLYYLAGFLSAYAINIYYPIPMFGHPLSVILALLFLLPSAVIGLCSLLEFRHAKTNLRPYKPSSFLVVIGPYRISRNPMYLSLTLLYIGLGLMLRIAWTFIFLPAVIFIMYVCVIRQEESYLESRFGEEYRSYKKRVRRWL